MANYYPFMVNLNQKLILVFGGGKVATRKVEALLPYGPSIKVVSPTLTSSLQQLVDEGKISWKQKTFDPLDLDEEAFLVLAATDQAETNRNIVNLSKKIPFRLNVSEPSSGNMIMPAIARQGEVQVAISTNGSSPALAKQLRKQLESLLPSLKSVAYNKDV